MPPASFRRDFGSLSGLSRPCPPYPLSVALRAAEQGADMYDVTNVPWVLAAGVSQDASSLFDPTDGGVAARLTKSAIEMALRLCGRTAP